MEPSHSTPPKSKNAFESLLKFLSPLQQVRHFALPIVIILTTWGTVYATLYFSHVASATPGNHSNAFYNVPYNLVSYIFLNVLKVGHQNPVLAILQGVNLTTALYAFFYYWTLGDLSNGQKFGIMAMLILINFVGHQISELDSSDASDSLGGAYFVSGLYLLLFAFIDYRLYRNADSTNARKAYYAFSCNYVQLPALGTLVLAFLIQGGLHKYGVSNAELLAFLGGVSAAIMFLSNVVLALMECEAYGKKMVFMVCPLP